MRGTEMIILLGACLLASPDAQASYTPPAPVGCHAPALRFRYAYLDSLVQGTPNPPDELFLSHANAKVGNTRLQIYLWYVLRHPDLAKPFFEKLGYEPILGRNDDALSAILWLMKQQPHAFGWLPQDQRHKLFQALDRWDDALVHRDPGFGQVLSAYGEVQGAKVDEKSATEGGVNVDLLLKLAVQKEQAGDRAEAIRLYTKVAEYGYQGGFLGAALGIVEQQGDACVPRATYYTELSGAIGPVNWLGTGRVE